MGFIVSLCHLLQMEIQPPVGVLVNAVKSKLVKINRKRYHKTVFLGQLPPTTREDVVNVDVARAGKVTVPEIISENTP